jgi:hypothetical protein
MFLDFNTTAYHVQTQNMALRFYSIALQLNLQQKNFILSVADPIKTFFLKQISKVVFTYMIIVSKARAYQSGAPFGVSRRR